MTHNTNQQIKTETLPHIEKNEEGKIRSVVTYLEMRSKPLRIALKSSNSAIFETHIERLCSPTVHFYRYLYNTVGEPWLWTDRRKMSDQQLRSIITAKNVEIYVLYYGGVPAGYVEIDRQNDEVELSYLGVIPDFIGHKFGSQLLSFIIDQIWDQTNAPTRFWVHTCSLDHPAALPFYKSFGFKEYMQETEYVDDPWESGLISKPQQ